MDPDGNDVYPIHDNGEEACWAMGKAGVEKHRAAGTLIWKRRLKHGGTGWEPYTREFAPDEPTRPFPTIWSDLATMRQAKAMLRNIFATSDLFSTPKPVELIQRILALIHDPHAVVLDFFAGSGTTAQAGLKLPRVSEAAVAAVQKALAGAAQVVVYSWQAPLLAQRIADARVSFEPIPESLVSRFGVGAGG